MSGEASTARGRGDSVAAAIGNASLLGLGYLLIGRRGLMFGTLPVTLLLLVVLMLSGSTTIEVLVLLWWAVMVVHGWSLARARPRDRRARVTAAAVTAAVLVVVTVLRVDAAVVRNDLDQARADGDCGAAAQSSNSAWPGTRLVDAPAAADGDDTAEACARLASARTGFDRAMEGDLGSVNSAASEVERVRRSLPGHERMIATTVDGVVERFSRAGTCDSLAFGEWLRRTPEQHPALGRSAGPVAAATPSVLVRCGDDLLRSSDWTGAAARYQQALDGRPDSRVEASARRGLEDATAGRNRSDLAAQLTTYCSNPFPYPAAPPPGPGGRTYIDASDYDPSRNPLSLPVELPEQRRAPDAATAAYTVCVGAQQRGAVARSCQYLTSPSRVSTTVSFHRVAVPVRVYEMRTGAPVLDRRVEVGDMACPPTLEYSVSLPYGLDNLPPDQDIPVSIGDVRRALQGLVLPVVAG